MIFQQEENPWTRAKEKANTITAIFGAITAGIIIFKTVAETVKEAKEAYEEIRKEGKER